jgi:hypothetical protein
MTQYVGQLAAGRYPRVRNLRRNDELKNFFERFQTALESMRAREADEAETLAHALTVLGPLGTSEPQKLALAKLKYLHYGLSVILVFLGVKMLIGSWVEIPILLSLGVIASILIVAVITSLISGRRRILSAPQCEVKPSPLKAGE